MTALILLALSFLLGLGIVRPCKIELTLIERTALSLVLGILSAAWIAFITSALVGFVFILPVLIVLTSAIVYAGLQSTKVPRSTVPLSKKGIVSFIFYTFFWSFLFLVLLYTHMFQSKPDGIYSSGNTWGDIALHSTYVEKFALQSKLDLTNPIYAQEQTTYPFLFDFYTSLLLRYGFSIQLALITSSFLLLTAFLQLTYFFILRLFKSAFAASLFPFIFLLNGGLGFIYFFQDWGKSGKTLLQFFFSMPIGYANLFVHHIYWSNMIADYLLPQRSFIASLAVFICILQLLLIQYKAKTPKVSQIFLISLAIAGLPFLHVHTFLISLGIICWFLILSGWRNPKLLQAWILPLLLLTIISVPQLYWQFSQTFGKGFSRVQIGWMSKDDNWVVFWVYNMGAEFILTIIGTIYLWLRKKSQPFLVLLLIPMLGVFGLINLFVFQPYDYDNTKFLVLAHFVFCLLIVYLFLNVYRNGKIGKIILIPITLILIASGGLSTVRETYLSWQISSNQDLAMANIIKTKIDPQAIFLTADSHNHLVSMLAGHSIVMGYRGWLWTHGINYSLVEGDVIKMFAGTSLTPILLAKYHISYVFIGPAEMQDFGANDLYFRVHYPLVFQNESGSVYDVRTR